MSRESILLSALKYAQFFCVGTLECVGCASTTLNEQKIHIFPTLELGMLAGPDPKIGSVCNGIHRSNFGLASKLLAEGSGPEKSQSQGVAVGISSLHVF